MAFATTKPASWRSLTVSGRQADYVRSVRYAFLEPGCVCSAFTPADEKLAVDLYRRGIPLENLRRAVWLGSARKYMAMLNGHPSAPIASLGYFTALLEEVARAPLTDASTSRRVCDMEVTICEFSFFVA
jgi:hypothetical protein